MGIEKALVATKRVFFKKILDNEGFTGTVLMDLSKALDTLNNELLIAKSSIFKNTPLKLTESYLANRWQKTKINKSFSIWTDLLVSCRPSFSVLI